MRRQTVETLDDGLNDRGIVFRFPKGVAIFSALWPTQHAIQSVQGALPCGESGQGVKLTTFYSI